ncbi:MAG: ABC transporter permease subunit [Fuerstiella sp.]
MSAYAAILKDSFREAIASRVLLIALIGIVVVLLLLAPFGLSTDKAIELRPGELTRPEALLKKLTAGADQQQTPAAHLWSLLDDGQQERLRRLLTPNPEESVSRRRGPRGNPSRAEILNQLNGLLTRNDFHDADSWKNVPLSDETRQLLDRSDLTQVEQQRRNLLLLAAAFSGEIDIYDSNAISLTYATATIIGPLPLTPREFEPIFERVVVTVVGVFLGFFGILGSLLVTAGIIPRTFEPGEISLLLSKPVRRSWLFVTRFLGGCIFTLLYAMVLVAGIWLLLGLRMDRWRHELLWCIPVYVFLFMIYYSVSAIAGVIWRNSIVALTIVVLFWLGLTVIGTTQRVMEDNLIRQRGIREMTVAGPDLLTVDGNRNTYVWNADENRWDLIFEVPPDSQLRGFVQRFLASDQRFLPVYDTTADRILALQLSASRFGGLGAPQLVAGSAAQDWVRQPQGRVPDAAPAVLVTGDGRVLLPTRQAIYQFNGQSDQERRRSDFLGTITGGLISGASKAFEEVNSKKMPALGDDFVASLCPVSDVLLMYSEGKLHRLIPTDEGRYVPEQSRDLGSPDAGVIAAADPYSILGLADGRLLVINTTTLETQHEVQLPEGVLPRVCAAAPDGSGLAVLTHDETVLLFDGSTGQPLTWRIPESGHCTAIAYSPGGTLLASDGVLAVHEYDVSTGTRLQSWAERPGGAYQFYQYVILPLWTVLPRPYQLDEFVTYVMSGEKTVVVNEQAAPPGLVNRDSLQQDRQTFQPVSVIRNNAIFVLVMLILGCVYISRRDF